MQRVGDEVFLLVGAHVPGDDVGTQEITTLST